MTAEELHALTEGPVPWQGGFTTERGTEFAFSGDDIGVHVHRRVGFGGAQSNHYDRLSVSEALEHVLALEKAIEAAKNYERNI